MKIGCLQYGPIREGSFADRAVNIAFHFRLGLSAKEIHRFIAGKNFASRRTLLISLANTAISNKKNLGNLS